MGVMATPKSAPGRTPNSAQRIVPNIWIRRSVGGAEQAGAFYTDALPFTTMTVESRYPDADSGDLPDFQQDFAGEPLVVAVDVAGTLLRLINAGEEFRPTPAESFMLNFDPLLFGGGDGTAGGSDDTARPTAREALDATWAALSDGGEVRMELGEYPFSPHYGWVEDRFGVNWQLMLTDPAGDPRPFLVPALMFGGDVQDRAAEAAEFYVDLFAGTPGGSGVGHRFPYGIPAGPASAEALAYGEFRLGDQWFIGNDMGYDHGFGFTPGISFEVRCDGQAEIDRLWDALSSVPEAEACGWLQDRYGVSWQIVPSDIDALLERPGAYRRMLGMRKLVIADF